MVKNSCWGEQRSRDAENCQDFHFRAYPGWNGCLRCSSRSRAAYNHFLSTRLRLLMSQTVLNPEHVSYGLFDPGIVKRPAPAVALSIGKISPLGKTKDSSRLPPHASASKKASTPLVCVSVLFKGFFLPATGDAGVLVGSINFILPILSFMALIC